MNEAPISRRDVSCGWERSCSEAFTTGTGGELSGVITAALCATTQNEQCEAGELCRPRASCT